MSMVHVENMAAAHLQAASCLRLGAEGAGVAGEAFNIKDFDQNIVALYHEAAGCRPPVVTLPLWLLKVLVRVTVTLAVLAHSVFLGLQILHPKAGLHQTALSAGLPSTMNVSKSTRLLKYRPCVTREEAMGHCAAWIAKGGGVKAKAPVRIIPLWFGCRCS